MRRDGRRCRPAFLPVIPFTIAREFAARNRSRSPSFRGEAAESRALLPQPPESARYDRAARLRHPNAERSLAPLGMTMRPQPCDERGEFPVIPSGIPSFRSREHGSAQRGRVLRSARWGCARASHLDESPNTREPRASGGIAPRRAAARPGTPARSDRWPVAVSPLRALAEHPPSRGRGEGHWSPQPSVFSHQGAMHRAPTTSDRA
jgi:hypothetical protein